MRSQRDLFSLQQQIFEILASSKTALTPRLNLHPVVSLFFNPYKDNPLQLINSIAPRVSIKELTFNWVTIRSGFSQHDLPWAGVQAVFRKVGVYC